MILLDTNLLIRMTRPLDPRCGVALVEAHGVTGFRAHDVRLVAAMQSHGITRLLTFNIAHFRGLPITILDPASP